MCAGRTKVSEVGFRGIILAMQPDTRYARAVDGVNIAYQVFGEGPRDLVLVPGWIFHIELVWEFDMFVGFMDRLARNFRVIMFDKRGTGMSDRAGVSTLEDRMDDVRTVMDAVGSSRATVMGWSEGGNIAALFAATYPQRCENLIIYGSSPRFTRSDDFPHANPDDFNDLGRKLLADHWGQGMFSQVAIPSRAGDPHFLRQAGRYERASVSPGDGLAMMEVNLAIDTRDVLPMINVPTLVVHNVDDMLVPVACGRYLAEHIPGARYVELAGTDHLFWFSNPDDVVGEIEEFVVGTRTEPEPDRVLATLLFTDIVSSTEMAGRLGDRRWKETLDVHDRRTASLVERHRGRVVKTTGDGVLATFDGPARAVACASSLADELATLSIPIRAGLHTGEIELRGQDVGGMAVHLAQRISQLAGEGEVLVSRTVKDLAVGAGITFEDRGRHELRGTDEVWRLFAASVKP